MALSANDYLEQLQGLLPTGAAWPTEPTTALTKLLTGLAQELARVDARADNMLEESDPRTAYETLLDWEVDAGLPDQCWILYGGTSVESRRAALLMRITSRGGQSVSYFIGLAALLGYPNASITEYLPMTCSSNCNAYLNTATAGWAYAWTMKLPTSRITVMTCGSACSDPLRDWGDDILECVIQRYRPAHTTVLFSYGG